MSRAALVLAAALLAAPAVAHDSWISRGGLRNGAGEWCCGEGDCFVVPKNTIGLHADGYHLQRHDAGGNVIGVEVVPMSEAQPSPDGEFWRCKRPDGTRRCFFAPPPGS